MTLLNKIGIFMFIVVAVLFFMFSHRQSQGVDSSGPKMSMEQEALEVSVNDSEKKLLEGITATDKKDGDVTESIVLESLSAFISDSTRIATYAAFDSDQHVVRGSRRITYTDYTKPEFSMHQLLEYPAGRPSISINGITAKDCIDGDISSSIKVSLGPNYGFDEVGEYDTVFSVVNSAGDVASFHAYIVVYDPEVGRGPQFDAKDGEYLLYLNRGQEFDPFEHIEDVKIGGRKYQIVKGDGNYGAEKIDKDEKIVVGQNQIDIEGEVDSSTPGEYVVKFSMTLDVGNQETVTGTRRIYVIVRDN